MWRGMFFLIPRERFAQCHSEPGVANCLANIFMQNKGSNPDVASTSGEPLGEPILQRSRQLRLAKMRTETFHSPTPIV